MSLFPPSTITLAHGVSFDNQTTLTSYKLASFKVPFDLEENVWHRISTSVRCNHCAVSVNQTQLYNVSLTSYYAGGSSISTSGAFGFGAWQDQSAYIRGVYFRDTTGNMIYHDPMASVAAVLPEYGQHENYFPTCVDGAKRDRLAWLGDFLHTTRIIGVTTNRSDLITVSGIAYLLPDYQILALISFVSYMEQSNDTAFAREHWTPWKAAIRQCVLGPSSGSAINAASIEAFKGMASVASAVGNASSAKKWAITYKSLQATLLLTCGTGVSCLESDRPIGLGRQSVIQHQWLPSPGSSTAEAGSPARFLLNNLWGAIVSNDSTKSGSIWEYVNQKSQPGYGEFTTLSHPWGGAATYALTNYVAGIRPVSFGYKSWFVEPAYTEFGVDK
ncbi:unnamed protein product [Penicillium pancosmium]